MQISLNQKDSAMKHGKLYQYVFALAHMSEDTLLYGDWIQTPGVSINSCNDGIRTVVFKITCMDEESDNLYTTDGVPTGVK